MEAVENRALPAVHINNVMSNFVLADLEDVRGRDIAGALAVLYRKRKKNPDVAQRDAAQAMFNRYLDSGAELGSMLHVDLNEDVIKPILDDLERLQAAPASDVGARPMPHRSCPSRCTAI